MLNYIWVALILLGVGAALTTDIINGSTNKYRNNVPFETVIIFKENADQLKEGNQQAKIQVNARTYNKVYHDTISSDLFFDAVVNFNKESESGFISIITD
ncbi:MAG: hypothetical protein OQK57_09165, partial [Ignavibacteriaceae bacterium]|nr:hypothetical protein [Ignavibacteriaceae bacterium]